jgi:hypothetical protein
VPFEPPAKLRADVIGERLVEQLLALAADARRERRFTCTMWPRVSDTATRCEIESNVFSSSRRERMTSSRSCMFSIALDS